MKSQLSACSVPDELVVVEEGCVFDETEALFHSVDKRLDLQVGHLVQGKEADASKNVQQVARLQVESLQILKYTQIQDISGRTPIQSTELKLKSKWHLLKLKDIDTDAVSGCIIYALLAAQNGPAKSISGCSRDTQVRKWSGQFTCPRVLAYIQTAERETLSDAERRRLRHPESDTH